MDLQKQEIYKVFDAISPTYDKINRIVSFGMDRSWRDTLASHLPESKSLHVLDVATGTGDQALSLLKKRPQIESLVGIDLSEEMLAIARKKVPLMQTIRADAEKIPLGKERFDAATISFGIRNVANPRSALQEIHRVLKKKGRVLVLEFSNPPQPIRLFYLFYLRYVMPWIGAFFSKDKKAYRYLNTSIEEFYTPQTFCSLLKRAGFTKVNAIPLALGAVTLYIGEKP